MDKVCWIEYKGNRCTVGIHYSKNKIFFFFFNQRVKTYFTFPTIDTFFAIVEPAYFIYILPLLHQPINWLNMPAYAV